MSKQETSNVMYAEDWLPIKSINNGLIQLDSGEYVTGVKIQPKNIFILDEGMRNSILSQLGNFYNTIDYEFWLMIADRPVDISVYLAELQTQYNQTNSPALRKLAMQDIEKANMFMSDSYNVVDTEYYLLFKEKKMDVIQKRIHHLISGLSSVGLNSSQTSNNDLRMILDNYLNDGKQISFRTVM